MCGVAEAINNSCEPIYCFGFLFCSVIFVIVAVVLVTQLLFTDFVNEECANNITVGDIIRDGNNYIGLAFTACPSDALLEAFTSAAATWSAIILQNGGLVPSRIGGNGIRAKQACSFLNDDALVAGNFDLDFLLVFVDLTYFDGRGGILGEAGPCVRDENGKPMISGMTFESADLRALTGNPSLNTLILHEMAHTLGFGVDWPRRSLIEDPIFPASGGVQVNNVPKFVGLQALGRYLRMLESVPEETERFVPLEDGRENGEFKLFDPSKDSNSGRGSIDLHWKREVFGFELMVATLRTDGTKYPLSIITIAFFADLEYVVDGTQAEPFTLLDQAQVIANDDVEELRILAKSVPQKSISVFT